METFVDVIAQYPHCDAKVLHAPGDCVYCDMHPDWQELRQTWGIAFTGRHEPGLVLCPSEQARPLSAINHWPGNTPNAVIPTQEEFFQAAHGLEDALAEMERMGRGSE